jgi:hypothetical protein
MKNARIASITAENDKWLRCAYAAAVAEAKDCIGATGPIRPHTPIGNLSDEWSWIASSIIRGWVMTRSQQSVEEGWDFEQTTRTTGLDPEPWNTGQIIAILPRLVDACPDLDWSKPIDGWSKESITRFLLAALKLVRQAAIASAVIEARSAGKPVNADEIARRINADGGGPLMTVDELGVLDAL